MRANILERGPLCREGQDCDFFSPRTVSHPILTKAPDGQLTDGIARSRARLGEERSRETVVPVFCCPNGGAEDLRPREYAALQASLYAIALTTEPGLVRGADLKPRAGVRANSASSVAFPRDGDDLLQCAGDLEGWKASVRKY